MSYDRDAYNADQQKVAELLSKMDKCFRGYPRIIVVLACSRAIAAMFGPANPESREDYIHRFPGYLRAMWKTMDEIVQ
jgi:hypothetical protein